MARRPEPRKSKLSGLSPVHPSEPLPILPPPLKTQGENVLAAGQETKGPPIANKTAAGKAKTGVIFYQAPEDTGRVRRAVLYSSLEGKETSLSDFIANAVMKEVVKYEKKYNEGKPFPPIYPQKKNMDT